MSRWRVRAILCHKTMLKPSSFVPDRATSSIVLSLLVCKFNLVNLAVNPPFRESPTLLVPARRDRLVILKTRLFKPRKNRRSILFFSFHVCDHVVTFYKTQYCIAKRFSDFVFSLLEFYCFFVGDVSCGHVLSGIVSKRACLCFLSSCEENANERGDSAPFTKMLEYKRARSFPVFLWFGSNELLWVRIMHSLFGFHAYIIWIKRRPRNAP